MIFIKNVKFFLGGAEADYFNLLLKKREPKENTDKPRKESDREAKEVKFI